MRISDWSADVCSSDLLLLAQDILRAFSTVRLDIGAISLYGSGEGRARMIDKKPLSERDICTKFISPAVKNAGWDEMTQVREEVSFTKGRIVVRGKMVSRGKAKRADYVLSYKIGRASCRERVCQYL